jgi:hypothetical protein
MSAVSRVAEQPAAGWTWVLLRDGPHVLATLSRPYLDRWERSGLLA